MFNQLADVSYKEGNTDLIYGVVDCKESLKLCENNGIENNLELKTFDLRSDVKSVINFLNDLVDEVLEEDILLDRWEKSGTVNYVLFKIVSCRYCKKAKLNWIKVKAHFADKAKELLVGTIDCNRNKDLCHRYGVTRYPRMFWFVNNEDGHCATNFTGERELPQLIEYGEEKLELYKLENTC